MTDKNDSGGDLIIQPGALRDVAYNWELGTPGDIVFASNMKELFRVTTTGQVILNENVPVDDATRGFWDIIQRQAPIQVQAVSMIREEELDAVIEVLERASDLAEALETIRERRRRL